MNLEFVSNVTLPVKLVPTLLQPTVFLAILPKNFTPFNALIAVQITMIISIIPTNVPNVIHPPAKNARTI
jgi:hypothetical protein